MKRIGFIGLGTMGFPMANNLLKAGYPLTVFNRTPEKAYPLLEAGAAWADSPAETARDVDVLITMLGDDSSLEEVYYGEEGILEGAAAGLIVIDSSTVSPQMSRRIYGDLAERSVGFLDAPVTGSKPAAEDGTLLFMVGGDRDALERVRDVLDVMGRKIVHMGPSGAGSQTKLVHNMIVGVNMSAFAEGMSLAIKAGLDPEMFADIVLNGAANSRQAELKAKRVLNGDFSVQFGLGLMLKDLDLASRMASRLRMSAPLLENARSLFRAASNQGLDGEDLSAVIKLYSALNGVVLPGVSEAGQEAGGPSGSGATGGAASLRGSASHGAASYGAASHGAASHDAASHDAASHGAASHGATSQSGAAQGSASRPQAAAPPHASRRIELRAMPSDRRRDPRVPLNIGLKLSVYQWLQEGNFHGQTIDGTLVNLSESGLLIASEFPLALDMFVVIHFPEDSGLPPLTSRVIRIEAKDDTFHYGCMLSGVPLYTRKQLERYIRSVQQP